jgi:hypothetical protein
MEMTMSLPSARLETAHLYPKRHRTHEARGLCSEQSCEGAASLQTDQIAFKQVFESHFGLIQGIISPDHRGEPIAPVGASPQTLDFATLHHDTHVGITAANTAYRILAPALLHHDAHVVVSRLETGDVTRQKLRHGRGIALYAQHALAP